MKGQEEFKLVKCRSGVIGWQCRLQKSYSDYLDFLTHSRVYGIAERLGFSSAREAWIANPVIQGSVNPSDLRVVSR